MSIGKIQLFNVAPAIPPELTFLETLARNMWWCWNPDAIELFRRINPQLWRKSSHNPLEFLSGIPQKRFEVLAADDAYLSHLQQVQGLYEAEVLSDNNGKPLQPSQQCIAYFSLEYGIHESIRLYSGGLGVLAGDHLKSSSDLNIPLVAVGLLYRQGYFQQYLNNEGWQQEAYPVNEVHLLPISRAYDQQKRQVYVEIPLPDGRMRASVWRMDVGRIPLYLLDTNLTENHPEHRKITARLYGGDRQTRLRQELLLGIGGYRVLLAMGHEPVVCHMNESHAAFVLIARAGHLCKERNMSCPAALEIVNRSGVFTTHTPVPAGNEYFAHDLLRPHLEALATELKFKPDDFITLGQPPQSTHPHEASMTVVGLRGAAHSNAVSKLHGHVARRMWAHLWPNKPEDEIPIIHVTNGIHVPSWLSPDMTVLYDRYLGTSWRDNPISDEVDAGIMNIPDEELWRAHELARSRLLRITRERTEEQYRVRSASKSELTQAKSLLDQDALTIGFARRFATYKRATLLLKNPKRLEALLMNEERPVQIIFAGKAHPADDAGKELIRQLVQFAHKPEVRRHVVFLENYDMYIARTLVQGVDVWLNTPRRPQEASGTSGMKASVNGIPNLSILDGWWAEGYQDGNGWAIGEGQEYDDTEYQDTVESQALFNLLENEVVPLFYDRPAGDVPSLWVKMMKGAIKMGLTFFTSHRMIREYQELLYKPAWNEYFRLMENNASRTQVLVAHREKLQNLWKSVSLTMPQSDRDVSLLHVGDKFTIRSEVTLGELTPEEVEVEVYYGPVDSENKIIESHVAQMKPASQTANGVHIYSQEITCSTIGRYGFSARAMPSGSEWRHVMPGFITWANHGG